MNNYHREYITGTEGMQMKYVVEFEINGTIEVTAESEDEATDIVEAMNLHEIIEDADGVLIDACAQEVDEEE